ncbi:hypothetical protein [Candidatus Poriferisodalis sp.]|uniref:hypothetical protein n=1 Tax=Candidatus Poriferisodalis sp. TaxID=3101277 RepID=UPI003B02141F
MKRFVDTMDGFHWLAVLRDDELDLMFDDLAEVLRQCNGSERRERLAFVMWDWQASAFVFADPDLRLKLSEPIGDPLGESVSAPLA